MLSMQVGGICADFASAAGQLCYADIEGNTRESEQVPAKKQTHTTTTICLWGSAHQGITRARPES